MDRDIAPLRDNSHAGEAGLGGADAARPAAGLSDAGGDTGASRAVTLLYQTHALGLTRLAFIVLGDRHAAEDVVQEAFCGLFRAWDRLPDGSNTVGYLRASVLNGCRTALRRQKRTPRVPAAPAAPSAEAAAMVGEEQRAAVAALRRLPPRQREALVLRYYDFSLITADASANTFVFGAMRHWERNANPSPRLMGRNQRTPMKFLVLHVTPKGHTRLSGLSLPEKLVPGQQPSIALSPDGTRLAVAFGGGPEPAYVQVITLANGQTRRWVLPHTSWTPLLRGMGAWAANGRTLLFGQMPVPVSRPRLRPTRYPVHPATTTRVWLLDTAAPGTSLAASRLLVLRAPAGQYPNAQPSITPDGTTLIMPTGTLVSWPVRARGALAVYSARTGRLRGTLAPWAWRTNVHRGGRGGYPGQRLAWSNWTGSQLIVLQPRDELNVLGSVTGHTFTPGQSVLLPQQPPAYQQLQYVLRAATMVW